MLYMDVSVMTSMVNSIVQAFWPTQPICLSLVQHAEITIQPEIFAKFAPAFIGEIYPLFILCMATFATLAKMQNSWTFFVQ